MNRIPTTLRAALPALALAMAACHHGQRSSPEVPSISSFSTDPNPVESEGPAQLEAVFSGGQATLEPGVGAMVSGVPVTVHPRVTTTYTLSVAREGAPTATAQVTVRVAPALDLAIEGLGSAAEAVTVMGPDGFRRTLGASALLKGLAPGDYTIHATPVPGPEGTLHPLRPEQTVRLMEGTAVKVSFAAPALTVALPGDVPLEFMKIQPGTFTMGNPFPLSLKRKELDPTPLHDVTFAKPFFMAMFPTTVAQWQAIMGPEGGAAPLAGDLPMRSITFEDIKNQFLPALNAKVPGYTFRLPSEAEWEYAARAGTKTRNFFGRATPDEEEIFARYAWNDGRRDHPVGRKWANPWGLYDLFGAGYQWCEDYAVDTYRGAPQDGSPRERRGSDRRILRGNGPVGPVLFTFSRYQTKPSRRSPMIIFRLVAVPK